MKQHLKSLDQLLDFGRAFRGLKVESLVLVNEERQLWLWKRIVESYYQVNEDWLAESKKWFGRLIWTVLDLTSWLRNSLGTRETDSF
mgnify:CR=1 FL=1